MLTLKINALFIFWQSTQAHNNQVEFTKEIPEVFINTT